MRPVVIIKTREELEGKGGEGMGREGGNEEVERGEGEGGGEKDIWA